MPREPKTSAPEDLPELDAIDRLLSADVDRCIQDRLVSPSPYHNRNLVRQIMASVEGTLYGLRRMTLARAERQPGNLTLEEVLKLREKKIATATGIESNSFMPFKDAAKFLFDISAKLYGYEKPTYAQRDWIAFLELVRVRDATVHPKSITSLEVTDAQAEAAILTFDWFKVYMGAHYARMIQKIIQWT